MSIRSLFLICLLCLSASLAGNAQTYKFRHYSMDDGLLNNEVRTMVRDNEGFLWIGTSSGLNRYDGHRLRSYVAEPGETTALPENEVEELLVDACGGLWVKTRNNWCLYVKEKDSFINVSEWFRNKGTSVQGVSRIYSDGTGLLWFISGEKLLRYDFLTDTFHEIDFCHDAPVESVSDNGKELFVLHSDCHSLCALNMSDESWRDIDIPDNLKLNRLFIDRNSCIWLYSTLNDALLMNVGEGWKQVRLESDIRSASNFIRSVQDGEDGKLWIATDHKGIFLYDKATCTQVNITAGKGTWDISDNSIGCAYKDPDGTLWIGYVKSGLSCHHKSFSGFENHKSDRYENISFTMEDSKGNIWVGTDGYGVFCHDRSGKTLQSIDIPGNIAVCMTEDSKGQIWIGTYLHGLICCKDGRIVRHYTKENSGLSDDSIYTLQEDKNGKLWVGSLWGYLQCLDPESSTFTDYRSYRTDEHAAMSMYYDGGTDLYVGMISGLWKINVDTGEHSIHHGNSAGTSEFKYQYIQSVYVDSRGLFWLGHNQGITVWDRKSDSLHYLCLENGLCDNVVRGISEDPDGIIWVTTSNGYSTIHVREDAESGLLFNFDNYFTEDGLDGDNFSNHSVSLMKDGNMLLGNSQGYTIADRSVLYSDDTRRSRIMFTGLKVGEKEMNTGELSSTIRLKHSDSFINIEYSAMELLFSERSRYAYKVDGLEEKWIETTDSKITFRTLPPGKYRLHVRSVSKKGIWLDNTASIGIEITPPFYRSGVAFCIYLVLLLLIIYICCRIYRLRLEKEREPEITKQEQKVEVSPSEITITSLDEQLLAKAIKAVEDHIDETDFSVDDLSAAVGFTRGHLYKKLMAITGKGPAEFIRTIRMKRAKQLLDQSQLHISEIAYSVGYSSPKIFSKNFKAEFGILPSEYQKIQKSK